MTVPVRVPVAAGVKVICKVQTPLAANVVGSVEQSALVTAKSPPVVKLLTVRLLVPMLVSVTLWAPLVVSTV